MAATDLKASGYQNWILNVSIIVAVLRTCEQPQLRYWRTAGRHFVTKVGTGFTQIWYMLTYLRLLLTLCNVFMNLEGSWGDNTKIWSVQLFCSTANKLHRKFGGYSCKWISCPSLYLAVFLKQGIQWRRKVGTGMCPMLTEPWPPSCY